MPAVSDFDDPPNLTGRALETLRKERKLSLRRAALLSEGVISHAHISDLEKGFKSWEELSMQRVRGLARAYGISPARLIEVVEGRRVEGLEDVKLYRIPLVDEGGSPPKWQPGRERTITLALPELAGHDESKLFMVRLKDDAMRGYARSGARVLFKYEDSPDLEDVVALEIPGLKGLLVRRFHGFTQAGHYLVAKDEGGTPLETPVKTRLWGTSLGVWSPDGGGDDDDETH